MSGDVQPRKRKEKRRKKEDSEEIPTSFVSDEQLHVHKDASTGGNICAKILFFLLSFVLLVMIGLVLFEYRGSADDETLVPVSKWAPTFDGWLETPVTHDEHADVTESGEQEHGESGEHENESAEGEEHLSEEAGSKEEEDEEEDEEEEQKGSEEEETKSEEEEEAEDEEADKLEDEESEEVDENEIDDRSEEDEQEEDEQEEEEEESEEDVYGRDKSEEDLEAENEDADDGEEEEEEEDVEAGREELDDEEERVMPVYHRESNEIDDVLSEIPGITESEEDEEGDNLGRSEEILDKLPKIPGVDIKKIKAASEEESDVPRRKREKEVSETTQPVDATSTITDGQKPLDQEKSQDRGQVKLKARESAVSHKGVTEKPSVPKHEKPEAVHPQDRPVSKGKHTHSTESPPVKNDGFPSGPGETGPGQKDDVSASKVKPSIKQKVGVDTSKNTPPEDTLPHKQKDDRGPPLKSEPLPADSSKPTVSGGKNVKDKDVSSDGVHSPPKASRIGDKVEHSAKVGKTGTVHKVTEKSSPTKVDGKDRVSDSKSPQVGKSTEELKKPVESKNKPGSESVRSASASGVKDSKFDTQNAQATTDETMKKPDSKIIAQGKVGAAGKTASSDDKVKSAINIKEKESVGVKQPTRESGNLNSQTKQEKKLGEKKKEDQPIREKENNVQFTSKKDRQAETVTTKDSSAAKLHEGPAKSKVDVEKQKASSQASVKTSADRTSEVPVKVSTDKAKKGSADNVRNRPPEMSADVNAAGKRSVSDNAPPENTQHSKPRDAKVSAVPEPTLKHSVRKEGDIPKTQEVKPSVQSASSHKNSQEEVGRRTPTSDHHAGHQENSGSNKPVNSNIKKPSPGQKVTSKRTENEVTQPESERSAERKAVPSQRDSKTVK